MKTIISTLLIILLFGACKKDTTIIRLIVDTTTCEYRINNFTIPHNKFIEVNRGRYIENVGLEYTFSLKYYSFDSCRLYYLNIEETGNLQYKIDTINSELFISDDIIWYFNVRGSHDIVAESYICDTKYQTDASIFILQSDIIE